MTESYRENHLLGFTACSDPNEMFACVDGQCLPKQLLCDGIIQCHDRSDELQLCGKQTPSSLLFNQGYK